MRGTRGFRGAVALAAAALFAAIAAPAYATTGGVTTQSYRITGQFAEGSWSAGEEDPGVGLPRNLAVIGAHATESIHENGTKPVAQPMVTLVAYSTTLVNKDTGEPYPAEVWAMGSASDVTIAPDLSSAVMAFSTDASVVVWDPVTEQEVVVGSIPLTVSVRWTGVGPLTTLRRHERYTEDSLFRITNGTETVRDSMVDVTLIWGDGSRVDLTAKGMLHDVRAGDMVHVWPELP